ncbi:MAG: DUF4168 domain-containing protein [Cyanobacteria bacterium J06649_4]
MMFQKLCLKKMRSRPKRHFVWCAIALSTLTLTQLSLLLTSQRIPAAHAQAITDDDVINYARAVLAIEAERETAYALASDILASSDTEIDILETPLRCTNARLKDMPDLSKNDRVDLRTVLVTFCNNAKQIADDNDLTPKRFNAITASHREDEALAERIKEEAVAVRVGSRE